VEHEVDEFCLARHIGVEGHHPGAESLCDVPHRECLDAVSIRERDCSLDDLVDAVLLAGPPAALRLAQLVSPQQRESAIDVAQPRRFLRHDAQPSFSVRCTLYYLRTLY